ncbi:acyl carrier protein [Clostridium aminobutyricum]|uniref:Acyl carrier protein n=1 Tax=Clostridium aminobutyricum TaxID=33953 RepID=A0A939D9V3_CLOAM|nr:acyl carrier protein [Clostridium aminobutyricum]MBN7774064.1 acyl carrier protein [Clostridium aminobutyricum]
MDGKLIEHMAEILEVEQEELLLDTAFKADKYDWDSLKGYAMLVMLEEEFGIEMPVDDFIEAKTIRDLFDYIQVNQ